MTLLDDRIKVNHHITCSICSHSFVDMNSWLNHKKLSNHLKKKMHITTIKFYGYDDIKTFENKK